MTDRIFAFWTGDNPISANRLDCFATFGVTGLEPVMVTAETLDQWVVADWPLHPAYPYLSAIHRSDYLRPYFMYHHGGGYADIKRQGGSWRAAIERVRASPRLVGAGYPEIRGGTVLIDRSPLLGRPHFLATPLPGPVASATTWAMRALRPALIGNGAYYFEPKSEFARRWLVEAERRLTLYLPLLKRSPATNPRARLGDPGGYPIPWANIHGDILQPLALLRRWQLTASLPRPDFTNYF